MICVLLVSYTLAIQEVSVSIFHLAMELAMARISDMSQDLRIFEDSRDLPNSSKCSPPLPMNHISSPMVSFLHRFPRRKSDVPYMNG